jgi:Bacterial Ig-like domain (group 3)/Fibronectin type III domain
MWGLFRRQPPARPRRTIKLAVERLEERCLPTTWHMGPAETYTTLAAVAAVAQNGDTIDIDAGTYTSQEAIFTQSNLTIQGVGGPVIFNDDGYQLQNEKGIFDIRGNNVTVKNIEFEYAHDLSGSDGDNFAGIRGEGNTLTIENCSFFYCDDGVLINNDPNAMTDNNDLTVVSSEFGYNGYGDGESHNIYVGEISSFTMEYCYSHDANQGHLVKSRALNTYLLYNYFADGSSSYAGASSEIDIPYGGDAYVIGNIIEKDAQAANHNFLTYNLENSLNAPAPLTYAQQLYVVNNTFVNNYGGGTYVVGNTTYPPSTVLLENNIFAGGGALANVVATETTNLATNSPDFVNWSPGTYLAEDYQLAAGSPAIGAGTQPGSANGVSLVPTAEYVDALSGQPRPVEDPIDIGAYAYGAVVVSPPAAPTDLTATAGAGQVTLSWSGSAGATSYNVYSYNGSNWVAIQSVGGTSTTVTGLTDGTTYSYYVTAVGSGGESGASNQVSATPEAPVTVPAPPTNLTAMAGAGQVALSWSGSAGATSYNVYSYNGSNWVAIQSVGGTSTTVTGLTDGTTYSYYVTAVDSAGESGASNEVSATPEAPNQSATALKASVNPSVYGQTFTLTATVTAKTGSGTPTGSVTFMDGTATLGTSTLNSSGVATLGVSLTTLGSNKLTAVYSGNASFEGSSSAALSHTVNKAATTVALSSSSATSVYDQAVTFTATVSAASPGSGTPTGTVTFYNGTVVLGTGTLSNGVATFTTSTLTVAAHTVKATYGSSADFTTSSKALTQTVKKDSTSVTASAGAAVLDESVTLTASVARLSPGSGTPTGTVTFKDTTTGKTLGTATLSNGTVTLSATFTTTGTHKITVTYSDDSDDLTSSMTLVVTVAS